MLIDFGTFKFGDAFDNVLTGTDAQDFLFGFGGNDTLTGLAGDDYLFGGDGNDFIHAGAGIDTIEAGRGNDFVNGGGGFDTVRYQGSINDYSLNIVSPQFLVVTSIAPVPDAGRDKLRNVEALYFAEEDYTLYLNGRNNIVLTRDDAFTIGEDDVLTFSAADLMANDQDFDGDRLRVTTFETTSSVGATITRDGDTFTYDPGALFDGLLAGETATDSFTYVTGDGQGGATQATVLVTIEGADDIIVPDARINEIHYDNDGSDIGEFVEIRVAAGTDPTDFLLEFYSNGTTLYRTETLSDLTPNTAGAWDYYTLNLPTNGIQNGPTDGIALSFAGEVIELLSYEGTFTATLGVAAGMTSVDIGVSEPSNTPIGFSLQRKDDGTWREPGPETPGGENIPPLAQLVINEIMQNPSVVFDSAGEWFELYNPGTTDIDINGWTVADNDTDSFVIDAGGPLIVSAGGYVVLGNNADIATNGGTPVTYEYSGMFLSNGADELVLTDQLGREVDRVEWDGGPAFPDPNGASMALANPTLDNNDGANWQTATDSYGDGNLGTPGAPNASLSEVLVINEIMQNPSAVADSAGEWFELYNPGTTDIDINGWTVEDDGLDSFVIDAGGPLIVSAGGYVVLGNNADIAANGGVAVDYEYSGMFLTNSSDELVLFNGAGEEIDRVEWDNGATFPDPNGASMSLNAPEDDNTDGTNWAAATTSFGDGDLGTPGAANSDTGGGGGGVGGGDPTPLLISQVQGTGSASPVLGALVSVTAIVTYLSPNGFFVQEEDTDADTDLRTSEGVFVFTGSADLPSLGDQVSVTGTVEEFFGLTQIGRTPTVEIVSSGNPLPMASLIQLGPDELQDFEALESMRIKLASATEDPLTIIENFNFDRFGEIVVSAGVQTQATQLFDAQTELEQIQALQAQNQNNRLAIDDGAVSSGSGNPTEFAYVPVTIGDDGNGFLNSGDTFTAQGPTLRLGTEFASDPTGVLTFGFGEYKMLVDGQLDLDGATNEGARQATPDDVGGTLQVGAFNVLNYFTTLVGQGTSGPNGLSPRGANSQGDLDRQTDKLVNAMLSSEVDVFAIQEVENNGFDANSAIGTLATALSAAADSTFAVVDPNGGTSPFIGTDAITTGIMYDTTKVTLVDSATVVFDESSAAGTFAAAEALSALIGGSNPLNDVQRNRPATVATFEDAETNAQFTVVSVHFKSKGSSGLETLANNAQSLLDNPTSGLSDSDRADIEAGLADLRADPNFDQGNGQGFWNGARDDAAGEVYDFLTNVYGGSGVSDYVILGDYNAYSQEDPTQTLADQEDTVDLLAQYVGEDAYSFVFDGQRGALDQAVASTSLASAVTGLTEWHINADEPDLLNYSSRFNDANFYEDSVFASSDHDPVILGLDFTDVLITV